jgi:hypothetical protein
MLLDKLIEQVLQFRDAFVCNRVQLKVNRIPGCIAVLPLVLHGASIDAHPCAYSRAVHWDQGMEKITFGGRAASGGVESFFREIPVDAVCGYAGGTLANPTYKQVYSDRRGMPRSLTGCSMCGLAFVQS